MAKGLVGQDNGHEQQLKWRRHEEHVLRILAENEMLRSTVTAYSTMETKDTRLIAALETTKQLLVRAEQREERIVEIYDEMLDKFARAWARRQRAKWLSQWAWVAIIRGSALGWSRYHSKSGTAFLNFTFHLWRDVHRTNIKKGGRVLMVLWRRDLQCLTRATRAWRNKSQQRQRRLRFYYVRCYRRSWDTFVGAVIYSRCTRRSANSVSHKSAHMCLRAALREWSQAAWRERAGFWRRHCRAAREALRQALQPSTYNDFLQRMEGVHGTTPGAITLEEIEHDGGALGGGNMGGGEVTAAILEQMRQQRQLNSRSIGVMTSAALVGAGAGLSGGGKGTGGEGSRHMEGDERLLVRGTPSRQEIRASPPPPVSPPPLFSTPTPNPTSPPPPA